MRVKRITKFVIMGAATFALSWMPIETHAAASFDTLNFKPTTDHGFYLSVEGSQTLGRNKFHATMGFDYSNSSLVLVNAAGNKISDIIGNQVAGHLAVAYGIIDWINVGLLVNFVPYQQFSVPATGGSSDGARMGDIELDFKFRLLDSQKYPVGIAIVPFVTFPTGSSSKFVGNGKFTGGAQVVLESKRIADRFSVSANVGAQIRKKVALSQGTTVNDQFLYGVGANFAFNEKVEAIAEVQGWTKFDNFFNSNFRPLTARAGVRFFPKSKLAVTVGGGAGVIKGIGAPDYEVFATIAYVPSYDHYTPPPPPPPCPDFDADGMCDEDDYCPAEAGDRENCGCPPHPLIEIDHEAKMIRNQKIFFAFDKATIKEKSFEILNTIASTLKVRPDIMAMRIIGHTDGVGSAEYNQGLSERRAKAILDYLVMKGVDGSTLTAVGKGESDPIAPNNTVAGRAKNRRVQFEILIKERELTSSCETKKPNKP